MESDSFSNFWAAFNKLVALSPSFAFTFADDEEFPFYFSCRVIGFLANCLEISWPFEAGVYFAATKGHQQMINCTFDAWKCKNTYFYIINLN